MKMTKLLLLVAAMIAWTGISKADGLDLPDGAVVKYRLDKTVTDETGSFELKRYDKGTGAVSDLRNPVFADGGLAVKACYAVDRKLPSYESKPLGIVMRCRLGGKLVDACPFMLTKAGSPRKILRPFIIDGDSIRIFGHAAKQKHSWWSLPLPKADEDGFRTFIYTRRGSYCELSTGDRRYEFYDDAPGSAGLDRLVICPTGDMVITELAVYDKTLSVGEKLTIVGRKKCRWLEFGEADIYDDAKDERGKTAMMWVYISFNCALAAFAVYQRRKPSRNIAGYRFNGRLWVVLAAVAAMAVNVFLYMRGGLELSLAVYVVSLISYIIVARRPVTYAELEEERALAEYENGQNKGGKYGKGELMKDVGKLGSGILGLFGHAAVSAAEAVADADRVVETRDAATGKVLKREKSLDFGSLAASIVGFVLVAAAVVGIIIFVAMFAMALLLAVLSFMPLVKFIMNRRRYGDIV